MGLVYLLNKINVVKSSMYELSSTTREGQELPSNLNPVLMTLDLCQFCMRYIVIPYLQDQTLNKVTRPQNHPNLTIKLQ
jgi:hypothetical protein